MAAPPTPPPPLSLKDALDYAWNAFQYHAAQRMQAFNFFLILMGALFLGYENAEKAGSYEQSALIAAFGAIVALAFLILDLRNEELVDAARAALRSIEGSPEFSSLLPASSVLAEKCQLLLSDEETRSPLKSHSLWLRLIQGFLLAISLLALASSLCKCNPTHPERRRGGAFQMPYIKQERRNAILGGARPQDAGELNFAITVLVDNYLKDKGGVRYAHLNEVVGAMDCAKLELYRRVAAPYEDKKIAEAGDVYQVLQPET